VRNSGYEIAMTVVKEQGIPSGKDLPAPEQNKGYFSLNVPYRSQ